MKNQKQTWIGLSLMGFLLMSFVTINSTNYSEGNADVNSELISEHKDPSAFIAGKTHSDNTISIEKIKKVIELNLDEDFTKKGFEIKSFQLVYVFEDQILEISAEGSKFNEQALYALSEFTVDQKFSIESIQVKAPTGEIIKIPAISLKVIK